VTSGSPEARREGFDLAGAAHSDPEITALWEKIQTESRDTQRLTIDVLQRKGKLHDGLTEDEATDLLYTLNHGTYHILVDRLGWSPQRYEQWLVQTLIEQLLAPSQA